MPPLNYHVRSLHVRHVQTLVTLMCVAMVVAVFCYLICFAQGLRQVFVRTGDPYNVIVLAEGSTAESNSAVTHDAFRRLESVPRLARDADDKPCLSPEVVVQTDIVRRGDASGTRAGVPVRGVFPDAALRVHTRVRLTSGRWFREGRDELIVGINAAGRFEGAHIGGTIECGRRMFSVVGVFRASGGAYEGELWGYLSNVASAYRRARYSSATLRLNTCDPNALKIAKKRIASASVALRGISEPVYYERRTGGATAIERMALALAALMGIGVVFAAMNSMHASVANRLQEFAMLRAIGFSRVNVLAGIVAESLAVSLAGGGLGLIACALAILLGGATHEFGTLATFTSVAFRVHLTWTAIAYSAGVSVLIGGLGGLWPAYFAARTSVVSMLRNT